MFIIYKPNVTKGNYPKYIITNTLYLVGEDIGNYFYYLIANFISLTAINKEDRLPIYLIALKLTFTLTINDESKKIKLNGFGTNYIFNEINSHTKDECVGAYPENYVFVKEPTYPFIEKCTPSRKNLKKFKK